jgi:hypothetical protein
MRKPVRFLLFAWALLVILGAACNLPSRSGSNTPAAPASPAVASAAASPLPSATVTVAPTPSETLSPSPSPTASATHTPPPTNTPTITPTPTYAVLRMQVKIRAQCRYGPGWPYLYKYGLVVGSNMEVIGRNENGTWALVQAINGNNPCWVRADLIETQGDIMNVAPTGFKLPMSPYYGPLKAASAVREGAKVTVYFSRFRVSAGNDSGQYPHMIEAWLCQDGKLEFTPYGTYEDYAFFEDEPGCSAPSHARIYGVEKHGYTRPIEIPWPPAE